MALDMRGEVEKTTKTEFSKSQLDRLGERLRGDQLSAEDLTSLDEYRRSFTEGYEYVVKVIRDELKLEPTGRPAKSTTSIRDKLKRESLRLSQMQDIAGCRIIIPDIIVQDEAIEALVAKFGEMKCFDRRVRPSHGYRAVHLIAVCSDRSIEIQVRSAFQHMWAELSEKTADVIDPAVKYGGGPDWWQEELRELSEIIAEREDLQRQLHRIKSNVQHYPDRVEDVKALDRQMAAANVGLKNALEQLSAEILNGER